MKIQALTRMTTRLPTALLSVALLSVASDVFAGSPPLPTMKDGFEIELIHEVEPDTQGSWVSLTVDDKGRLITSDQYGKLYRITLTDAGRVDSVQPLAVDVGSAHGLLYAFDSLYVMMNAGDRSGLYRLQDTNGDDQFDRVERLLPLQGNGEHGPHAIVPSPDGKSLYICAGNHTRLPNLDSSRLPQNWQEDLLLPRMWDANGHATGILAPGGFICRIDPDGGHCELISSGYRNEFDISFGPGGELFTYDADMEWDIGLPWYRPTRIVHATSGSEFGWRSGTGKWPAYYRDSLPAVVDIGPGSPTGITFGYGAKFPEKYQRALFAADWSYGILFAVHLEPHGATFRGTAEVFATGQPFPVADVLVHPKNGSMYVTTGGRKCQSGLFRIHYTGNESTAAVTPSLPTEAMKLRRRLESFHTSDAPPSAIDLAWPHLSSDDRFVRYAARLVLEHQPTVRWKSRIADTRNIDAKIECAMALARSGSAETPREILESFADVDLKDLTIDQQLGLLRCCELVFSRLGAPDEELRGAVLERLDPLFPASDPRLNRELGQLLIYLKAPYIVPRCLEVIETSVTQQDRMFFLLHLRGPDLEWTLGQRRAYLKWIVDAVAGYGGRSYPKFIQNILAEYVETLSDQERNALAKEMEAARQPIAEVAIEVRPTKHVWTVEQVVQAVDADSGPRDIEQGRQVFAMAQCYKCHRFLGSGGIVGPDLSAVAGRYGTRDLVKSMIEPAKMISDQYQMTSFELQSGKVVTGRIVNLSDNGYMVAIDLLQPEKLEVIAAGDIEAMTPSSASSMPTGLLDVLELDELLDLVAYLRSKP